MGYLDINTELIKILLTGKFFLCVRINKQICTFAILRFVTFSRHSYCLDILKIIMDRTVEEVYFIFSHCFSEQLCKVGEILCCQSSSKNVQTFKNRFCHPNVRLYKAENRFTHTPIYRFSQVINRISPAINRLSLL